MTDSLYQTFGKLRFPAQHVGITDGLQSTDPARDGLLELFKTAINTELGDAWTAAIAQAASPDLGALPVTDTYPMLPSSDVMQQRKAAWPCLFLGRDLADQRNRIEEHTLWQERLVCIWTLHYIFPALTLGDRRKFDDVLISVVGIIDQVIRNLKHPAYQSGAFALEPLGLSSLRMLTFQAGQARFAGDEQGPLYTAMTMTLESQEISGFVEGTEVPFDKLSLVAGTGNGEGVIPVTVEALSEAP